MRSRTAVEKKSYTEQLSSQYLVLFSQGSKDWPVWLSTKRATLIWTIPKCYNWIVQRASTGKDIKGQVIIYRLGRRRILWGITWFLGEQKGRSVVTENPKGGIAENFGKMKRGYHSSLLGKWRYAGGGAGIAKVIKSYYWRSNTYRGDRLNFTSFTFKSSHPQAIHNDRSLRWMTENTDSTKACKNWRVTRLISLATLCKWPKSEIVDKFTWLWSLIVKPQNLLFSFMRTEIQVGNPESSRFWSPQHFVNGLNQL